MSKLTLSQILKKDRRKMIKNLNRNVEILEPNRTLETIWGDEEPQGSPNLAKVQVKLFCNFSVQFQLSLSLQTRENGRNPRTPIFGSPKKIQNDQKLLEDDLFRPRLQQKCCR